MTDSVIARNPDYSGDEAISLADGRLKTGYKIYFENNDCTPQRAVFFILHGVRRRDLSRPWRFNRISRIMPDRLSELSIEPSFQPIRGTDSAPPPN